MRRALATVLLSALTAVPGCVDPSRKGLEDEIPGGGKDDSFFHPTDHGRLAFLGANEAELTADEGFHSWNFTLSGDAEIELRTELEDDTPDTVMYLYRRTSATASWGSYIKRNDDAGEETYESQIADTFGPGEYRVLVKAYERTDHGPFSLAATCTGDGCPPADDDCEVRVLPASTGYGGSCGAKLGAIFRTGSTGPSTSVEVAIADRCSLPPLRRAAVDYYVSYFSDLGAELEAETLQIETQVLDFSWPDGGALVSITDGGDESTMTLVLDYSGEVVAMYQHNQSPDVQFFCREANAAMIALPNVEDCMGQLINEVPHAAGDESAVDLLAAPDNLPIGLSTSVADPMRRYAMQQETSSSTMLTVEGVGWQLFDGRAGRITISSTGRPATSYLATDELILIETATGLDAKLVCE